MYWKIENKNISISIISTHKAKVASGRLSYKQGYNQRCQWYQNLPLDIPKLPSYIQSFIKICDAVFEKNGYKMLILCNVDKDNIKPWNITVYKRDSHYKVVPWYPVNVSKIRTKQKLADILILKGCSWKRIIIVYSIHSVVSYFKSKH